MHESRAVRDKSKRSLHRSTKLGAAIRPMVSAEALEPRRLFTAGPTITLTAPVATGSGITGANAQLEFTRTGSTAKPINVFYHATGTLDSHQYTKLSGVVTIHGGQSFAFVDIKPKTGLIVSTDPTLSVVLTQYKTYRRGSPHVQTLTITENHGTVTNGEQYSLPITLNSGSYVRTDEPVSNSVDFASAISAAGGSGALLTNSIDVVETDSSGNVVNSSVPYQFDETNGTSAGNLVIDMTGTTAANTNRFYKVEFATTGSFTAPTFTNQVSVTSTTDNVGFNSFAIANATATYYMQKTTGGISEILDANSNDWVGFNSSGGSNGEYRGTPNLGVTGGLHPSDGSFPDAGNDATVTQLTSGPLESSFHVVSTDGNVDVTYTFYNNFVTMTVNNEAEASHYWMLYEGTPGGSFNSGDSLVASDGTNQTLGNSYDAPSGIGAGNSTTGQWASFQSASENRFIYFAQNTQDTNEDSYYDLNGQMTVFGFGRTLNSQTGGAPVLSGSNTFTFGIGNNNSTAAATINGQYRAITANTGTATAI